MYTSFTFSKSFQTGELDCFLFTIETQDLLRYFFLTISCHIPSPFSSFHHHLQSRLMFIFLRSFIPSPPFSLVLQILLHLTRWYFLLSEPPCQKNLFLITSIFFRTVFGNNYIDMLYIGMLLRQTFRSLSLPPRDSESPFHPSRRLFIFSTRAPQSTTRNLDPETGTPRYFIGQSPTAQ